MRTRQKRVATDTWRSLGCRTTPLEHWRKRQPTNEPRYKTYETDLNSCKNNKLVFVFDFCLTDSVDGFVSDCTSRMSLVISLCK